MKTVKSLARLPALAFGAALLCGFSHAAIAQETIKLRFSSPLPKAMGLSQGVEWWADEVARRTEGRVTVETFHGGSLLGAVDTLPGMQDGRIDLGYMTAGYWPAQFPLWNAVGLPFLTSDPEADMKAWAELYQNNALLRAEYARADVIPLFYFALSQTVFGTSEEVGSATDLDGTRLRAIGYIAEGLRAAGSEPIALSPGEVYEAIQRGVIDGFGGWPFDLTNAAGFPEVAPNFFLPGVGQYTSSALSISERSWDELPPDVQQVLREVSRDYMDHAITQLAVTEVAACDDLIENGGSLTIWSDEQIASLQSAMGTSAMDRWVEAAIETGVSEADASAFIDAYLASYETAMQTSSYKDVLADCAARAN
jgi:TRAP-type C4-dicarboxylate transport system substrate-binding protein